MNDEPLKDEPLGLIVNGTLLSGGASADGTYLSDEAMQEFARQWNEHHAHGHEYMILDGNATPAQLQQALQALGHPEDLEVRPLKQHQPRPENELFSMLDDEAVVRGYAERHPEFQQIRFAATLDPAWEQAGLGVMPSTPVPPGAAYQAWGEVAFETSPATLPAAWAGVTDHIEVGLVPDSGPASLEYKPNLDAMTTMARGLQAGHSVVLPSSASVPDAEITLTVDKTVASENFNLAIKASQLAAIEREVLDLQGNIERAQWGVVKLLTRIQEQDLFLAAYNEAEGRYYRSFSEYLPDVLARWYQRGLISTDSVRQIRTYLRAQRIFLNPDNGFELTREDITDLGITHFERLAEALDYDKETGRVAETPRAGKLGVAEAAEVLADIREGTYTVQDTRAALDELRGVTRKNYSIDVRQVAGDHFELRRLMSWDDGVGLDLLGGMSRLDLDRLCKALGIKEPHIVGG